MSSPISYLGLVRKVRSKLTNKFLSTSPLKITKDEVLCDLVPMEATHILLGRPWQFDKKAFHDGHSNKFSFNFQGKKITLLPLSPREVNEDQIQMLKKRKEEKA